MVQANTLGSLLTLFSHSHLPLKSQWVTCSKLIMVADAWFDSEHDNQISRLTYDITSLRSGDLSCIVIS